MAHKTGFRLLEMLHSPNPTSPIIEEKYLRTKLERSPSMEPNRNLTKSNQDPKNPTGPS
jgi:hypothetical protein